MIDYRARNGGDKAVVMLHGFGASSADLVPLAGELDPERRFTWYFPQAPYTIRYAGAALGTAWFPRSEEQIADAVGGSYFHALEEMDPEGLRLAGAEVGELIEALGHRVGSVILGGFSQGAMVAVETMVQSPERPRDLLLFSGSLIAAERWQRGLAGGPSFRFFQSHGTADAILPIEGGRRLNEVLKTAGGESELVVFDGGHGIPTAALQRVEARLNRRQS
jgi:phospholipase/carboxylesterase